MSQETLVSDHTLTIDLFLHGRGRPDVVVGHPGETLRAFLERYDALPGPGEQVFLGEAAEIEADADEAHAPADVDLTLEQLGLGRHGHVHTCATHRIEVTVFFNGQAQRRFSPARTIASITAWAKRKLHVDPTSGADLVLVLRPTGVQPRPDQHLGEVVERGVKEAEFDLTREVTPQG